DAPAASSGSIAADGEQLVHGGAGLPAPGLDGLCRGVRHALEAFRHLIGTRFQHRGLTAWASFGGEEGPRLGHTVVVADGADVAICGGVLLRATALGGGGA
ncbi:hypothetical protein ADL35_27485, partial [Streptomyces sp. NRRL WC-3753]